jgi:hypothetical protein
MNNLIEIFMKFIVNEEAMNPEFQGMRKVRGGNKKLTGYSQSQ